MAGARIILGCSRTLEGLKSMWIAKLLPVQIFSRQARRPSGLVGRYLMPRLFNTGNADLNGFVKECLDLQTTDRVLEIGFGPGKLIHEMAKVTTEGVVEGIDFSREMLKRASRVNKTQIAEGRVLLHEGDCGALPFGDGVFTKLCTSNTIYFWPRPRDYISEIFRVTRKGGSVVIGFRDDEQMSGLGLSEEVFRIYSQAQVIDLLEQAGFVRAHIREKEGLPFLSYCAVANKT
jgi:ubiquinone/menaquinone biosynthesis C-methylase UbiE